MARLEMPLAHRLTTWSLRLLPGVAATLGVLACVMGGSPLRMLAGAALVVIALTLELRDWSGSLRRFRGTLARAAVAGALLAAVGLFAVHMSAGGPDDRSGPPAVARR